MTTVNFTGNVLTDDGIEANVCVCVDERVVAAMAERLGPDFPLPLLEIVAAKGRYAFADYDDDEPDDAEAEG
jgi:hypothetical protein